MRTLFSAFAFVALGLLSSCGGGNESASEPDTGTRYRSYVYASSDVAQESDLAYSTRPNMGGMQYTSSLTRDAERDLPTLTMRLDVFEPPLKPGQGNRPLVVFVHGGGFQAGDKGERADEAVSYARLGYVTATVNYRLTPDNDTNPVLRQTAITHATEDLQNAVRYLKANAARWSIDVNRVAIVGTSAGGALALTAAVMGDPDALEGTESDYDGVSSHVGAVVSTGATLIDPLFDSDPLLNYDAADAPVLLFHVSGKPDSATGATWEANVLPTKARIDASGNTCEAVPTPEVEHTIKVGVGSNHWPTIRDFLYRELALAALPA
jgi:acetyl esterase/lipase